MCSVGRQNFVYGFTEKILNCFHHFGQLLKLYTKKKAS